MTIYVCIFMYSVYVHVQYKNLTAFDNQLPFLQIAPMRFFYRVAQEEQRLEAPLHQRPSTPGLGACLPPNDVVVANAKNDNDSNVSVDRAATPRTKAKQANDEKSTAKDPSKVMDDKVSSPVDNKQTTDSKAIVKNVASKSTTMMTTTTTSASTVAAEDKATKTTSSSELTVTNATSMSTTTASTVMSTTMTTTTSATVLTTTAVTAATTTTVTTATTVTMATTMTMSTMATTTATTTIATTTATTTTMTTTCNDANNKQMKSPIKIMKNPDGRYEVLRSPSTNCNGKERVNTTTALPDVKPASPEFSVVSIGNGQNSNGVKITLKQCSPTSSKKPKVISNILLRCGQQLEKDTSSPLMTQQPKQKDKEPSVSPPGQVKQQEKQRRKVTFVDQLTPEKTTSSNNATGVLKTALKKPGEQQDKKQFLQGFQLTARESVPEDTVLKSPVQDFNMTNENNSPQKKNNAMSKTEVPPKKGITPRGVMDEVKGKSNTSLNTSNSNVSTNTIAKRIGEVLPGNNTRPYATRSSGDISVHKSPNSSTNSSASANVNANTNGSHSTTKMDMYSFHSSDSSVLPGAVKRKCPPGVPINDLKRTRHHAQPQNEVPRKLINIPADVLPVKRSSSSEHMIPTNRTSSGMTDYHSNPNRPVTNVNTKPSTGPTLSNDTRNLLDGCGLNIPSSLSITLTSPKPPGTSLFPEITDSNDSRKASMMGKMNPTITLNDRSVDPRVLKALKTGQIKMPASPKTKLTITKQTDQSETHQQQQRITPPIKRSRREESILDLSGGKKTDIHPLRIPQPVTKLKANNKTTNNLPDDQVVTLIGGHRYYRAPPGSLTPAAHRVNECSPLPTPSRAPVYAPSFADLSRTGPNLSSVFPSLQSLYVLSQSQFQMDGRLRLPSSPRSAAESIASAVIGGGDGGANPCGLSSIPGKTHLAAQCAPVKPARSSVASLAVPISKQQHSIDKSASISIRSVPSDMSKSVKLQRNNEAPADNSYASSRLTTQMKYSSNAENANKFSPRSNTDGEKSNDQTNVETSKNSTTEIKSESTDNSKQQQHHDTASPRVSSTASPSPPPGNNGGNSQNENATVSHGDSNANKASSAGAVSIATSATSSSSPKSNVDTSCKSPASPDSSSITVESPTSKSCASSTDRAPLTDSRTTDTTTKSSDSVANPGNSNIATDDTIASTDDKIASTDDKNNKVVDPPTDNKQQLTTEIVQKRLLAVFPSNEWANNPEAAEHLGNFLKSLNATIKEESKADKIERTTPVANDASKIGSELVVKPKKDVVEHS